MLSGTKFACRRDVPWFLFQSHSNFHTTTPALKGPPPWTRRKTRSSSLKKPIKPSDPLPQSSPANFTREEIPHPTERPPVPEPKADTGPSFRRLPQHINQLDWKKRKGRWIFEKDYVSPSARPAHSAGATSRQHWRPNAGQSSQAQADRTSSNSGPAPRQRDQGRSPRTRASYGIRSMSTVAAKLKSSPFQYGSELSGQDPEPVARPNQSSPKPPLRGHLPTLSKFVKPPPVTTPRRPRASKTKSSERFTSPPLLPGLVSCLTDLLGPNASPTAIQSMSIRSLLPPPENYAQYLLASETGSGKSIAYLLPVLQALKESELAGKVSSSDGKELPSPRALILAPTHELSRQLSGFAKALLHEIKLRVVCSSQNIVRLGTGRSVDMLVGTPMKALEMARGRGWDREEKKAEEEEETEEDKNKTWRRGRDSIPSTVKMRGRGQPEMGLQNVEWVVVDEADVLFDPDFERTTNLLLQDIAAARSPTELPHGQFPFNLLLTTATIPTSLATYLDTHMPNLQRLTSPNLHHLPYGLRPEYAPWTGGNKRADIEKRLRKVWAEEAAAGGRMSKVLIFCNKSSKVTSLGEFLEEKGIPNVALTSAGEMRQRGSNKHLDGFMKPLGNSRKENEDMKEEREHVPATPTPTTALQPLVQEKAKVDDGKPVNVMITTSLLSRGLDFSPDVRHVFIVDEPRNIVDFLHRAGRAGRAGEWGKVVIFGKQEGRGSKRTDDVKARVKALL